MPAYTSESYEPHSGYSRNQLVAMARQAYNARLIAKAGEKREEARKLDPDTAWAYGYAGKPREFIGEILGGQWYGSAWTAWRSFISAVFGEEFEEEEEAAIYTECTERLEVPTTRPSSVWMPIGRRGGKSRILAAIAVYLGATYDWSPYLSPGELGVIPVLAADRRQARTIMGYVRAFLDHPRLVTLIVQDQAETVLLSGNIVIEVVTASFRAVRSRTVLAALCDEIAFWHSEDGSANPDHEIIAALRPAMATIPNALLLGASSPYARRGVLWDNYDRWYGKDEGPLIWKAPTRRMNPSVPEDFIKEKFDEDPIAAAAEYGAEFRSDVDSFIDRDVLDRSIMRDVAEIPFAYHTLYKAFCDPSGGSSDSMTLAIGHIVQEGKVSHAVLDVLREIRPPFSPEDVVREFADLLLSYKITRVRGDHYAGEWPRDRFSRCGITYDISERYKSDIYLEFLPILNQGRAKLLDNRRMWQQFLQLERKTARGGHESIDHPPGAHDDVCNVAAEVVVELIGKRDPTDIAEEVLLKSRQLYAPASPLLGTYNTEFNNAIWR